MNPWAILIGIGVMCGAFLGGWHAHSVKADADQLKIVQAQQEERLAIAKKTFSLQEKRDAEIARTESDLAAARRELRNRAAVRLVETPAACAGASPSALSQPDAEFLVELAAEADLLRANYAICREFAYPMK